MAGIATKARLVDVARAAGVSVSAASVALSGKPGVSGPTRDRVLRSARDLGYVRDAAAASLRSKRSGLVGLIAASFSHRLVDPFVAAAPAAGWVVAVAAPEGVPGLADRGIDALVILESGKGLTAWAKTGRPLVCVGVDRAPKTSHRLPAGATVEELVAGVTAVLA